MSLQIVLDQMFYELSLNEIVTFLSMPLIKNSVPCLLILVLKLLRLVEHKNSVKRTAFVVIISLYWHQHKEAFSSLFTLHSIIFDATLHGL